MATTADDVREIALSLPGSSEKLAWGMPTFRVGAANGKDRKGGSGGKIFAALADDDTSIGVKCPREDREELIAAEPEKFFIRPGHDDNYAWLRVRLAAVEDTAELRSILTDAWRQAAPKRLAAAHPELDGPGPRRPLTAG
ncbi:MmcQ/YjbR family DNA-binding protein [Streptomyces sp. NBC_01264]|uniref:MmcQ/YjbR family DNA-binding protein n=1 Tax=Streptomyces sp. NBC_01264 TaxID=2903804 RepID=UPI002250860A|nr:MmcQ/YjbR family DNA-binding protein [Streptomyces sp. NBC_01264]MCX4782703.1 MmcQ/YjbR family DNA-binding protein [Streptomyces sp. NBC_01264]